MTKKEEKNHYSNIMAVKALTCMEKRVGTRTEPYGTPECSEANTKQ